MTMAESQAWQSARSTEGLDLPTMFAAQAKRTPDATALIFKDEQMTYAALAARVNQLARFLIARGIGPDAIVPIAFDKSIEMVVSILAVVTAGGAWLPLDTEAPEGRIDAILSDSGAGLMLTSCDLASGEYTRAGLELVCLDDRRIADEILNYPAHFIDNLERINKLTPDHLVYVFYTSGTTGKPKGVANIHKGLSNSLNWMIEKIGIGSQDRCLQRVDYTFDVSIWDTLLPLVTGGTLIICEPGAHRDSEYVAELIQRHGGTLVFFVPTTLMDFLQAEQSRSCVSLRNVVAIGEALSGYLQSKFYNTLPHAVLWNSYGPTEAAIGVTLWRCRVEDGDKAPPIGEPSWNTQLHILDADLQPVATGAPGELFIAGIPLARGYHRRPELTDEKFLPDPFGPAGGRMYRTGDTVERHSDGQIYFLGREDSQIKFNGIRIEPGEIEATIANLPGVARVAVIARVLEIGSRLVAYVIAKPGAKRLTISEIRDQLSDSLPRYMIPSFVVYVDTLPQTTSGKLDARSLPNPNIEEAPTSFRAPRDETETLLTTIFTELTGANQVGIDHSFFDLGATSLTAMRLAARIKAKTGLILPMRALVDHPTPAGLATVLKRPSPTPVGPTPIPARPRPLAFLFPGAGGSDLALGSLCSACASFIDMREMNYPDWRQLCCDGSTFDDLVESMATEVSTQAPEGVIRLMGYSFGGEVAFEVARKLISLGRDVTFLGILDTPASATGEKPKRPNLWRRLARQWRDGEIGLAISTNFFSRVPRKHLPNLANLLSRAPFGDPDAVERRLRTTAMDGLHRLRQPDVGVTSVPLQARTVLFRIEEPLDPSVSFAGWAERCKNLSTVMIEGEHLTILSHANLPGFVARLKSALMSLDDANAQ